MGKTRVVSEHEYARVSELKTMLEFKNMLARVGNYAHEERLREILVNVLLDDRVESNS